MIEYPKRLIEVDLPIKRISAHARREKSIRHGHISTLHIWWARRPLAACRAVICAALWPDPADPLCPPAFREATARIIADFAGKAAADKKLAAGCDPGTWKKWCAAAKPGHRFDTGKEVDLKVLRQALLDFIADFANWDNSTVKEYLETSRALTQAAHEALGGAPGTRPLVVDPFAGGGSIPLEALRVGADSFASDLNPIAVLLNLVLETLDLTPDIISLYLDVAEKIKERHGGAWEQGIFAKFWSRTIRCEGPGCGVEIPLLRDGKLSMKDGYALHFHRNENGRVEVEQSPTLMATRRPVLVIAKNASSVSESTCRNGSVTCPVCDFTHKQAKVARQALDSGFGHRLIAIGQIVADAKCYRSPSVLEEQAETTTVKKSRNRLSECLAEPINPKRPSPAARGMSAVTRYGYLEHRQLFSCQQLNLLEDVRRTIKEEVKCLNPSDAPTIEILLAITLDRLASFQNAFCRWAPKGEHPVPPFGKNGFPMIWDYVEANPFGDSAGSWDGAVVWIRRVLQHIAVSRTYKGVVERADSQIQMVPDGSTDAWITDPPYYDSYPYADLSDFFYPVLKSALENSKHPVSHLFVDRLTPKDPELVLQPTRITTVGPKDHEAYRTGMTKAFSMGRTSTRPDGIGVIVFANKTTGGWEALLASVCDAGWKVTASWPIDTERESRAAGQARLQSSVHLVCRPRENADSSTCTDEVGDWRDVLAELPRRIHEWMPRLAEEGVVGADAIFACLGPALEIFSRYSKVEKASGEAVTLKEYLEQVWAAVAKEALTMIFRGADATGFEEDARLTAMWLWTLKTGDSDQRTGAREEPESENDSDEEGGGKKKPTGGFVLEFDAARKIAQGLGAHLEDLKNLIEVHGDTARLLPVAERARFLFGKTEGKPAPVKKKRVAQMELFKTLQEVELGEPGFGEAKVDKIGATVLDRVHQGMILFAAGRGEALKRFLVDDGAGGDSRFWRLAQALSALYPTSTEEKRWVDGVLARKKSLGF